MLKTVRLARRGLPPRSALPIALGAGASFASTLGSTWLIHQVERDRSLLPYAAYRLGLAAVVLRPPATAGGVRSIYDNGIVTDAYAAAGVDTRQADRGVAALVSVLSSIQTGRERLSVPLPGHYASVIRIAPNLGVALATDSVGSKVIVAEQAQRFSTIGIDCVAMNVNDLICVGAEPLALLDYLAVESADPALLAELAEGLRAGAEDAGVEIPGGEVCQLPEVIRGHPSPYGFDLVGSAFGTVALDAIVDGRACAPGDALIGLPASGVHSNGLTLARARAARRRRAVAGHAARRARRRERRRRPARAHRHLRARGARPAALGRRRPRAGPHHRRRPAQPAAARRRRRLRDHRAACRCSRCSR